jgi:hypothetical protein
MVGNRLLSHPPSVGKCDEIDKQNAATANKATKGGLQDQSKPLVPVATAVGPPKDSVFIQNLHMYGTPRPAAVKLISRTLRRPTRHEKKEREIK